MDKAYKKIGLVCCILALLCSISLMFGNTIAFLSDGDIAENVIDIGGVSSKIEEEFQQPGTPFPGQTISKKVSIVNDGSCACYVRTQILFSDDYSKESCQINFNTDSWIQKGDWWYYLYPLEPGETTEMLFDEIIISENALNIVAFDVTVRQESWQAKGYDDCFSPWI